MLRFFLWTQRTSLFFRLRGDTIIELPVALSAHLPQGFLFQRIEFSSFRVVYPKRNQSLAVQSPSY